MQQKLALIITHGEIQKHKHSQIVKSELKYNGLPVNNNYNVSQRKKQIYFGV